MSASTPRGHHRGIGGAMLTTAARLLAAANKEIAHRLGISAKTVSNRLEHIYT